MTREQLKAILPEGADDSAVTKIRNSVICGMDQGQQEASSIPSASMASWMISQEKPLRANAWESLLLRAYASSSA